MKRKVEIDGEVTRIYLGLRKDAKRKAVVLMDTADYQRLPPHTVALGVKGVWYAR